MKILGKILKWTGIVIVTLLVLALAGYLFIYQQTEKRFNKKYEVTLKPIELRQDSATFALGKHLSIIKGCVDCHGEKLQGGFVINDPAVGVVYAPNITSGQGSKTANYTDEDWIRSIKHGVNPEGRALWIMPSYEYDLLSEEDLGALILYVKNAEPVDSEIVASKIGPVGRVLTNFNKIPLLAAENINHGPKDGIASVKPEPTAAYGKYLSTSCIGCHRENFQGGGPLAPGFPSVPNITSTGNVGKYTEAEFTKILRTGITPDGRQIDPKNMPWSLTKEFSDLEISALYKFLQSLPNNESAAEI